MRFKNLLLVVPFLVLFACSTPEQKPSFVYTNVNGYTIEGDTLRQFDTFVVWEGKFYEVGGEELLDKHEGMEVVNGEGKTVLPGLIDAHGHVMGLGYQQLQVDLMGITSLDETLQKVKEYAEANPELEWIQGRGWNQVLWEENEFPTAADLDEIVSDRPVWLRRVDGHAAWGNTKALEEANITKETEDPVGGKILRDTNGEATGVFIDRAMGYVGSVVPEPNESEQRLALQKALEKMGEMGITSVHDAGTSVTDWKHYTDFADNGNLTTRIYSMISGAGETFDELSKDGPVNSYADDMLSMRSVKLYSDGALGSRGAAMIEDYSDDPGNRGLLFSSQEEMNGFVLKTAGKGFQTNIHAIGDDGNRQVLDAFEYAINELGDEQRKLRHRIEHSQIVSLDDIPRFKELDIIASMQPTHATSDKNMAEDRVGPQRILGGYAWQRFLQQGTVVASGSDFPVEDSNPFFGLYSAVTRQGHDGEPVGGWYADQAMSRMEALRSFTLDAAYAAHQENVLGTIEEGKWADFIMIDQDYFKTDASNIWQIDVQETWVAGRKVYSAK